MPVSSKHIYYFDYLRIFAISAVMLLHINAQNFRTADVFSSEWMLFNIGDSITRWGVPVFVMISGALFLRGDKSILRIYKKNILRLIIAFFVWAFFFASVVFFQNEETLRDLITSTFSGYYHMWFIYMIIGLYIIVPILRLVVKDFDVTKYFLILVFVFTFLLPQILTIWGVIDESNSVFVSGIIMKLRLYLPMGYIGYFVLGYYLNTIHISKRMEIIIYILGILGFVITITGTAMISYLNAEAFDKFYNDLTCNVLFEAMAVFTFAKKHLNKAPNKKLNRRLLIELSAYSFGAYLVHAFILDQLNIIYSINTLSYSAWIMIPVLFIIVFNVSFFISAILNHIPILGKYIV